MAVSWDFGARCLTEVSKERSIVGHRNSPIWYSTTGHEHVATREDHNVRSTGLLGKQKQRTGNTHARSLVQLLLQTMEGGARAKVLAVSFFEILSTLRPQLSRLNLSYSEMIHITTSN